MSQWPHHKMHEIVPQLRPCSDLLMQQAWPPRKSDGRRALRTRPRNLAPGVQSPGPRAVQHPTPRPAAPPAARTLACQWPVVVVNHALWTLAAAKCRNQVRSRVAYKKCASHAPTRVLALKLAVIGAPPAGSRPLTPAVHQRAASCRPLPPGSCTMMPTLHMDKEGKHRNSS